MSERDAGQDVNGPLRAFEVRLSPKEFGRFASL